MNKNEIIILSGAAAVAVAVKLVRRRNEKRKRAQLIAEHRRALRAITRSYLKVARAIDEGKFHNKSFADVKNDFEFFTIVYGNE